MIKFINYEDIQFPEKLKQIKNPPKSIFYEGNINLLKNNLFSIVGTRNPSKYGEKYAKKFTSELLKYNLNIVSGMALGIDTIAHKVSVNINVPTIAVLPCGLENIYPSENKILYKKIIENGGLVLSEYLPNKKAVYENFLERNRIVAGISIGVLITEAAHRSGTSVTARLAFEQEKNVFCIPGNIDSSKSIGTNNLIKNGAKLVTQVEDIIENYEFLHIIRNNNSNKDLCYNIKDENERKIFEIILNNESNIDTIKNKSGMEITKILQILTTLEIYGMIEKTTNLKYRARRSED